ncbi:Nucleoside-diphosphate-sugar epimerase [Quadrisphaera granulorum]|uniref:Nucleoside-diphosphate-sugar epimerase n=1 Tax=Quadrisphaera granulorum TaxID=317664 RepID=A0A316A2K4_9ACTN|nr:NAD-dependent epimerase/dehydratase family protein [Quadrisphaera granulorum]PWJ51782.1 nucleoside-diphosphate-sugar epimerase [Quadrisphaera granulorum]SZE97729.1 Nucleoside-diphosphate-sugar epimerase [Quadrisphaera granulorum]
MSAASRGVVEPNSTGGLHVVLGAGAVGTRLAVELAALGARVRVVSRSSRPQLPGGVELVHADAADPAAVVAAARGAAVVHQVLNPAYHRWEQDFPPLQAGAVQAARAAGARLVSLENVYLYGRPAGRTLTEDSPHRPHARKGRVRQRMAEQLEVLREDGELDVVQVRASDFYGPGAGDQSAIGDRVLAPLAEGRPAWVLGDPDQPHTYTYVPDVARAMALLGTTAGTAGVWHVPNDPRPLSTRQVLDLAARHLGDASAQLRTTPTWALKALGLVNRTMAEVAEMAYEFEEPFLVSGARLTAALGLKATPYEQGIAATVDDLQRRTAVLQ